MCSDAHSITLIFDIHVTQVDLIGYQCMAHLPQVDTGDAHFVLYIEKNPFC